MTINLNLNKEYSRFPTEFPWKNRFASKQYVTSYTLLAPIDYSKDKGDDGWADPVLIKQGTEKIAERVYGMATGFINALTSLRIEQAKIPGAEKNKPLTTRQKSLLIAQIVDQALNLKESGHTLQKEVELIQRDHWQVKFMIENIALELQKPQYGLSKDEAEAFALIFGAEQAHNFVLELFQHTMASGEERISFSLVDLVDKYHDHKSSVPETSAEKIVQTQAYNYMLSLVNKYNASKSSLEDKVS